jgi:hypothetical protein
VDQAGKEEGKSWLFLEPSICMQSLVESMGKRRSIFRLGLALLAALAIFLSRFATWHWGAGVSDDSILYMSAAESFLKGDGISVIGEGGTIKPLTHFPPLYPLSLSALGYFIGVREAANWWAAILFGINAILITLLIFQATKSQGVSLLGGLLAIGSPLLLGLHLEAMSESLYLSATLASFILLAGFLRSGKNWHLILAAAAASLAYLTRYIGVAVLLTGLFSLFLLYPGSYRAKLQKAILYSSVGFIPNFIWYARNYRLTGSLTNRVLSFHPATQEKLKEGLLSISQWIFPRTVPIGLSLGLMIFIFIIAAWGLIMGFIDARKGRSMGAALQRNPIPVLLVLHVGAYIVLLSASLTLFDISTRLDNRILMPLYAMFLILVFIGIRNILALSRFSSRKIFHLMSAVLLSTVVIVYASRSWDLVRVVRQEGSGFNSAAWRNSEIIAILRRLDSDVIIYSNEALPVYYLTGIAAYGIPEKFDPVKSEERKDFQFSMEVMRERLKSPNGALVVFNQGYLREGMPTLDEIAAGFVIAHESRDGVIFVYPQNLEEWEEVLPKAD